MLLLQATGYRVEIPVSADFPRGARWLHFTSRGISAGFRGISVP
jgi:hypothetical protein